MQQNLTITEGTGRVGALPDQCDVNMADCKGHEVEKLLINNHAKSIFDEKRVEYGLLIEIMQSNISFFAAEIIDVGGEGSDGINAAYIDKAHAKLYVSSSFDQLITIRPGDSVQEVLSRMDDVLDKVDQRSQGIDVYAALLGLFEDQNRERLLAKKKNSKQQFDVDKGVYGNGFYNVSAAEMISLIHNTAVTIYGSTDGRDFFYCGIAPIYSKIDGDNMPKREQLYKFKLKFACREMFSILRSYISYVGAGTDLLKLEPSSNRVPRLEMHTFAITSMSRRDEPELKYAIDSNKIEVQDRLLQWSLLSVYIATLISSIALQIKAEVEEIRWLKGAVSPGTALLLLAYTTALKLSIAGWTFESMIRGVLICDRLTRLPAWRNSKIFKVREASKYRHLWVREIFDLSESKMLRVGGLASCWVPREDVSPMFEIDSPVTIGDLLKGGFSLMSHFQIDECDRKEAYGIRHAIVSENRKYSPIKILDQKSVHCDMWRDGSQTDLKVDLMDGSWRYPDTQVVSVSPDMLVGMDRDCSEYKKSSGHVRFEHSSTGITSEVTEAMDEESQLNRMLVTAVRNTQKHLGRSTDRKNEFSTNKSRKIQHVRSHLNADDATRPGVPDLETKTAIKNVKERYENSSTPLPVT